MSRSAKVEHLKRLLATALASGMFLVLSSCGIPQLRQADPIPPLPNTFNGVASPKNSAELTLAEFFNDPVLLSLVDQALLNNRELRVLEEEVEIARAQILARQGAYLPFIFGRASGGLDTSSRFTPLGAAERELEYLPGRHFPNPRNDFLLSLDIFWQLDIWRELRNARDAAAQRYFAALERRNDFVTRLIADVAQNYFALMALDQRLQNLDQIIDLQEKSVKIAQSQLAAAKGTELGVQRFLAEVRRNQSQKLIVRQNIIETENRINYLVNRFPQPVARTSTRFFELSFPLALGVPAQLLQYRPDIRQAERALEAAGLDVKVVRAHFFPRLDITGGVGYEAFNPRYLFWTPEAMVYQAVAELLVPLVNKKAIQADFRSANARQLEAIYDYQRVTLNAFTEVVNRLTTVQNYGRSIEIKRQQLESLEASVNIANKLFLAARTEYIDVLFAQRDLFDARAIMIETRQQQLAAIVNTYQALGGGALAKMAPDGGHPPGPGPTAGHYLRPWGVNFGRPIGLEDH